MQTNKLFKIPKNILLPLLFIVGILICIYVAILATSAFDEVWDGYRFNFFFAIMFMIMFSFFMLPGLTMIVFAATEQKRFSKIILLCVAAFFIIFVPFCIIKFSPKSPWTAEYTSINKKFAVRTWYNNEKHQTNFIIENVRNNWGIHKWDIQGYASEKEKEDSHYKITETTSSLVVTFYDAENKQIDYYEFDMNSFNTETREWVVK